MNEILEDLKKSINEKENEITSIQDQLLIENLKTSILKNQLRGRTATALKLLEILHKTKQLNKSLEEALSESVVDN